ncbi:TPA: DUF4427 domain-containing protein [Stenotrophomonas maltophilia]
MKNNVRFDLSDYLIHFFRDIDMSGKNAILLPEHMAWHTLIEGDFLASVLMLRAALRNGRLWATWSYRKGARTIYGPNPAVCLTDMPISAFVESSRERHARGEAMGEVALVFPKRALRDLGAHPAIYGLSESVSDWPKGKGGSERIIPTNFLPLAEQYRYVSYNHSTDWTHEREWRWPCRVPDPFATGDISDWEEIPGLDFYKLGIKGIGAIVRSHDQANLIISDMLTKIDTNVAAPDTFSFVLVTDDLPDPATLRDRDALQHALSAATIELERYFDYGEPEWQQVSREFEQLALDVARSASPGEEGEHGGCWLWLHDGTSDSTRMLLASGRVIVSNSGRYLAELPEFSHLGNLSQREEMTERLAVLVRTRMGIPCATFSVAGSFDPEAVPFYAEMHDNRISYYNASWMY